MQSANVVSVGLSWIATVTLLLTSAAVQAAPVKYLGGPDNSKVDLPLPTSTVTPVRNSFLASLSSYGIEDLEDLGGQLNPTLTFSGTSIAGATAFSNGVQSLATFSVSGSNFLYERDGVDDWIEFSQPVTAFGSYIVQSGDGSSLPPTSAPTNTFTIRLENTISGTSKDVFISNLGPDAPFFNVIFVGITDTEPFNRVSFRETYDVDGLLWDDLIAGYAVPEPATILQLAIGAVVGLLMFPRLRRLRRGR